MQCQWDLPWLQIVIDTTLWDESWQDKPRIPAIRTKEGSVHLLTRYIDKKMPKEVIGEKVFNL